MPSPRPKALLCDLGGTLLRGVPDQEARGVTVDTHVLSVVEGLRFANQLRTLFITSIDERSREPLTAFLLDLGISFDKLYMRRVEDATLPEPVLKRWVYDMIIAPAYDVRLVLEDDPSVAKMFRTLNVPTFLVSEWSSTDDAAVRAATSFGRRHLKPVSPGIFGKQR